MLLNSNQEWKKTLTKVKVVMNNATKVEYFDSLEEAKKVHPTLDMNKNTKDFTWAMKDGEYLRFEDWGTDMRLSG